MKRFEFRLERVLHYLRQQELVQSGFVASIQRDLLANEQDRERQRTHRTDCEQLVRQGHAEMNRDELTRSYAHITFLTRRIGELELRSEEISVRLTSERLILHEMVKRRRVVEELRVRKRATYDLELGRLERQGLDDANSRRDLLPNVMLEDLR